MIQDPVRRIQTILAMILASFVFGIGFLCGKGCSEVTPSAAEREARMKDMEHSTEVLLESLEGYRDISEGREPRQDPAEGLARLLRARERLSGPIAETRLRRKAEEFLRFLRDPKVPLEKKLAAIEGLKKAVEEGETRHGE